MLNVSIGHSRTCDGLTRRQALRVGVLGMAGLTMADALRLRAAAADRPPASGPPRRDTAVIQVFLSGGPSHIESYDPKPDAPKEFRGEFKAIATRLPGISLGEHLPLQAALADRLAVIRSLSHDSADHGIGMHRVLTGFPSATPLQFFNDRPSVGSIVSRLRGPIGPGVPPYVTFPGTPLFSGAAYLGAGANPFGVNGDPQGELQVRNLDLPKGLDLARLDDRKYLLTRLDRLERDRDTSGLMDGQDEFTTKAYQVLTGPQARRAFDISKEDPRLRDRYGRTQPGQGLLLARRLVEAGVTFVTADVGNWDHHGQVFALCRRQLPPLDRAIAALVEDLASRGLTERVLVVVWGEFGRTPRINGQGGRDHWPGAMSALLHGGGLRMGQVIGATDRRGEGPSEAPCKPEDVLQTIYHVLGIDPDHEFKNDAGRPIAVLNVGRPIAALL